MSNAVVFLPLCIGRGGGAGEMREMERWGDEEAFLTPDSLSTSYSVLSTSYSALLTQHFAVLVFGN